MSARTQIAETLRISLPAGKYRIVAAPAVPDNVTKPTILIWQDRVERSDQIQHDHVLVHTVLWLLTGVERPEAAEEQLEDGISDVIDALRPLTWAAWDQAERLTYGDSAEGPAFHAYRIILTSLAKTGD